MASAPPANQLPLFYQALEPISSDAHGAYHMRQVNTLPFFANVHAVPLTIDEFSIAQRTLPIVFTVGDDPVPIALFGLNEGVNVFVDADGAVKEPVYIPAYVRRYPFMLARLRPEAEELSLCFDPTAGNMIGPFEDGTALFEGGQPSQMTKDVLGFNEQFEQAGQRTANFMRELREMDLLHDGEVSIQPDGASQPFIYRGFQMINEEKLRDLRGDQLRKMQQSGMLPILHAHLFSLSLMREVFGRQMQQGRMPQPELTF